jgi:ABC-type thiamine transport system ATPase subunit
MEEVEVIAGFASAQDLLEGDHAENKPGNGPLSKLAQECLEFAEGNLDRVEVRRALRPVTKGRAGSFDRLSDARGSVGSEVVMMTMSLRLSVGAKQYSRYAMNACLFMAPLHQERLSFRWSVERPRP